MIKEIQIKNFKSLHGEDAPFTIKLHDFTCLVGLNGAGKSTILQFFDFLYQIMGGEFSDWLKKREWNPGELSFQGLKGIHAETKKMRVIWFKVIIDSPEGDIIWEATFNPYKMYCSKESVFCDGEVIFKVDKAKCYIYEEKKDIDVSYEGSYLSVLKDERLPFHVVYLKIAIKSIRSLELLTPHALRKRSRGVANDVGRGGERITAFLDGLTKDKMESIAQEVKKLYKNFDAYGTISMRAGWKRLLVIESFKNEKVYFDSKHASDGLLRIIALVAESFSDKGVFLIDEMENGINPESIGQLVNLFLRSGSQVVATTHSPLVLNYLDDNVAIQSVQFIYKTSEGYTRSKPFFEIANNKEKLSIMGPGEIFLDTHLEELSNSLF